MLCGMYWNLNIYEFIEYRTVAKLESSETSTHDKVCQLHIVSTLHFSVHMTCRKNFTWANRRSLKSVAVSWKHEMMR